MGGIAWFKSTSVADGAHAALHLRALVDVLLPAFTTKLQQMYTAPTPKSRVISRSCTSRDAECLAGVVGYFASCQVHDRCKGCSHDVPRDSLATIAAPRRCLTADFDAQHIAFPDQSGGAAPPSVLEI